MKNYLTKHQVMKLIFYVASGCSQVSQNSTEQFTVTVSVDNDIIDINTIL